MNCKNSETPAGKAGIARYNRLWSEWIFHACRLLLGLVFVSASYDKILHPQAFAQAVFNYQIVPEPAVNLIALILPWLELLLGLCLLFGVLLPGAIVAGTALLVVFLGALVFNQLRGLDVHCGCFSTEAREGPAGLGTVLRDIGFFAVSLYLWFFVFFKTSRENRSKN